MSILSKSELALPLKVFGDAIDQRAASKEKLQKIGWILKENIRQSLIERYSPEDGVEISVPAAWRQFLLEVSSRLPARIPVGWRGPSTPPASNTSRNERDSFARSSEYAEAKIQSMLDRWRESGTQNPKIAFACYFYLHICGDKS